jgi:hypothetical protein
LRAEVERSGVDVVHSQFDRSAEHGDGLLTVAGAAVRLGCQTHRAEAEPVDSEIAKGPGARRGGVDRFGHGSSFAGRHDRVRTWQLPATLWDMEMAGDAAVIRGEEEVFMRTAHLFAVAQEVACAANTLATWAASRPGTTRSGGLAGRWVRKLYRPGVLLEPGPAEHLRGLERMGVQIRITPDEINETIILDQRTAILCGDLSHGERTFIVVNRPEVVQGVTSLFDAAWRQATPVSVYDAEFSELRALAPQILDALASGRKDETAARGLGLSLRTYRRRVAELMDALGATSRFQAGARAHELGLI